MKIVLKIGGAFLDKYQDSQWIEEVACLHKEGHEIIIVHGAGPYINKAFEDRNIQPHFIEGQRVTKESEVSIVEEVLSHQINPQLVNQFLTHDIPTIGISGTSAKLLQCSTLDPKLGKVGQVDHVNHELLIDLSKHAVVILSPVGISSTDSSKFNVNADVAAAKVASSLNATLIFLTGERGLLDENKEVIPSINRESVNKMIDDGSIAGGMIVKARMIQSVLEQSEQVALLNAESERPLVNFVLKQRTQGTLFIR